MDIKKQVYEVLELYKDLFFFEDEKIFRGKIKVLNGDYYELEINIHDFPKVLPVVKEVLYRIPRKADRHIYEDNGNLCFTTSAIADILLKTKVKSLKEFIMLVLIPYLRNNSYFEIHKRYFEKEYSHGNLGIIESYKDVLKINNELKIARIIFDRIENRNIGFKDKCYCGSNLSLKKCLNGKHDKAYREFKLINKETLTHNLVKIIEFLKK